MRLLIYLIVIIGLFNGVCLDESQSQETSTLSLQIRGEHFVAGVPEDLLFVIANKEMHDVYLPTPSVACESPIYDGQVSVVVSVKQYDPRAGSSLSSCTSEDMAMPPIKDRIKRWVVLHSGQSVTVKASMRQLNYSNAARGVYLFTGYYNPPYISATDAMILRDLGINYPHTGLKSETLTFATQPEK